MNTPNNRRRRESRKRIEAAFMQLIQNRELNEISVTEICQSADINRTTFYANYVDLYDLAEAVQKHLEEAASRFDSRHIEYHISFFGNGLNAVIRKWLDNGCRETPEEMVSIITEEYSR